jgi:hypothetical protein
LDYATWSEEKGIKLTPFEPTQIPLAHLQDLIKDRNINFRFGDILLIRSGFTAAYNALSEDEKRAIPERPSADFSGIESSELTLRFLWENQFAAVAGDAPSFERGPITGPHADPRYILHEWLLGGWGMPIGEMFDLEKLSETCRLLERYTFFFSSMPLKVRRSTNYLFLKRFCQIHSNPSLGPRRSCKSTQCYGDFLNKENRPAKHFSCWRCHIRET